MTGRLRGRARGAAGGEVAALVRASLALDPAATVTVAELQCGMPGCPPVETVVLILQGEARYRLRVFKPVARVGADDIPPAWYLPALALDDSADDACC